MKKKIEKTSFTPAEKKVNHSHFCLIVKMPFRGYAKGDRITDYSTVNAILNCHESTMVIKTLNKG